MKKNIAKIALDAAMAVFYLLLMNVALTGIFLHELLGVAVMVAMGVHLFLNRAWIKKITTSLFDQKIKTKTKLMYALNVLLLLCMSTTMITGIVISKELFAFANLASSPLYVAIHTSSAYLCLILLAVHVALHWKFIAAVVRKMLNLQAENKNRRFAARVFAFAMALAIMKVSIDSNIIEKIALPYTITAQGTTAGEGLAQSTTAANASDGTALNASTTADTDTQSLEDYMSKLICTACPKRCPLTSPRCGRGRVQAQQAEQTYYESLEA